MTVSKQDFAILDRFDFEKPPVGIKYFSRRPEGLKPLEEKKALCEMLQLAFEGNAFFVDVENHTCPAGPYVLGQSDIEPQLISGEFGAGLKLFDSPRSAARLYHYIPKLERGVAEYVGFSPLKTLDFDPDVLLCLCDTDQTEILLRAMSYKTGQMWSSRYSGAIGCTWLLVYPYLSGEVNYSITGLGHGMKRRHLFSSGKQFVAIPFDQLPAILNNLQEMIWDLPGYQPDGMEFVKRVSESLGL